MSDGIWVVEAQCYADAVEHALTLARVVVTAGEQLERAEQAIRSLNWRSPEGDAALLPSPGYHLAVVRPGKTGLPTFMARFMGGEEEALTGFLSALAKVGWPKVRLTHQLKWAEGRQALESLQNLVGNRA